MTIKEPSGANVKSLSQGYVLTPNASERAALRWASIEENDRVLDLDCGDGALLYTLSESMRIRACGMCREHREARSAMDAVEDADVICARPGDIPFRDHSFETVFVTRRVGENTTDTALSEIRRVLRPGGQLIISCHLFPGLHNFFSPSQEPELEKRRLMRALQAQGFEHVSYRVTGLKGVVIGWKRDELDNAPRRRAF